MWPLATHSRLLAVAPAGPDHKPLPLPPTRWGWASRIALAHFWEGDHLKDVPIELEPDEPEAAPGTGGSGARARRALPLAERVRRLVEGATGVRPEGRVCLLTHLRYLGYVFNPVSFYYVWDKEVGPSVGPRVRAGGWVEGRGGAGGALTLSHPLSSSHLPPSLASD